MTHYLSLQLDSACAAGVPARPMIMSAARMYLSAIALAVVAGCFSIGREWTGDQVRQLRPGMTMDEVTAIMGPPFQSTAGMPYIDPETGRMAGTQTQATLAHSSLGGTHSISLTFGPDGRLVSVPTAVAGTR